jgi:hypothetical protein
MNSSPGTRSLLCLSFSRSIFVLCFLSIALLAWPTAASLAPSPGLPAISSARGEIVVDSRPRSAENSPHHHYQHHHQISPRSQSLPQPFDTSLSDDSFTTSSCPAFFASFLSNSTIADCHAISLLLQDSSSFFNTLSSAPATSRTLDAACAAPFHQCASIFASLAADIRRPENCGHDLENGNPLAQSALTDFRAYEPLYKATCLTNPVTDRYCFVDAVFSNVSADYNVYFVPLGVRLSPEIRNLTCGQCLQATMDVFSEYAEVDGQPLAKSYLPSAKVVNRICGSGFADVNVSVGSVKLAAQADSGAAGGVAVDGLVLGWSLLLGLGVVWLG